MTTDMPEQDIDATTSVIRCIVADKKIDKLLQNMLATCTTVEEYTERLNGYLGYSGETIHQTIRIWMM